jgi:ABC-type antimicrobial peptide transport system permease subunit
MEKNVHSKRKRGKENKMVTVTSFLVFILLTSLLIAIDITTNHYSLIEAWGMLFYLNILSGRIILYCTLAIGFISAIIIDIRILKKKRKKQTV